MGTYRTIALAAACSLVISASAFAGAIDAAYTKLGSADLKDGGMQNFEHMSQHMGMRKAPALYLNTGNMRDIPQAQARIAADGKPFIVINNSALEKWTPVQLNAVLGHELVHLKENDVSAKNLARAASDPQISVTNELRADRIGAGPQGSCDPHALKEAIEIATNSAREDYLRSNPYSNEQQYNQLVGASHPDMASRAAQLEALTCSN